MRVASWTPLEETRKVAMEKNVHLHIVLCALREHGSMSKALGCQAAFAWLASILHHYQSFMPQQTFVQWKKNLGFFLLREIYIPSSPKKSWGLLLSFCPFLPETWLTLHCIPKFEMHSYSSQFATCWERRRKSFRKKEEQGKKNPMNVL